MAEVTGMTPFRINKEIAKEVAKSKVYTDNKAKEASWNKLVMPSGSDITTLEPGEYQVINSASAKTMITPAGDLPGRSAGTLSVHRYGLASKTAAWVWYSYGLHKAYILYLEYGEYYGWKLLVDVEDLDTSTSIGKFSGNANKVVVTDSYGKVSLNTDTIENLYDVVNKAYVDIEVDKKADEAYVTAEVDRRVTEEFSSSGITAYVDDRIQSLGSGDFVVNGVITPQMYGATGDGVSDDAQALNSCLSDAKNKQSVVLIPDRTYFVSDTVIVPEGVTVIFDGLIIGSENIIDSSVLILMGANTVTGEIAVETRAGENSHGVRVIGKGSTIESIRLYESTPNAGTVHHNDSGVYVYSENTVIERLSVTNYMFSVILDSCLNLDIQNIHIDNYGRGVLVKNSKYVNILSGRIHNRAPNAPIAGAGYNAILVETRSADYATSDLYFSHLSLEDSAEHGFRLGGTKKTSRVHLDSVTVKNANNAGVKILNGTADVPVYCESVNISNTIIENCGVGNVNTAGFLIHTAKDVVIDSPIIKNAGDALTENGRTYAALYGFHFQGSENIVINNPLVMNPVRSAFAFDQVRGDLKNLVVNGGLYSGGAFLMIDCSNTAAPKTVRNVWFKNINMQGNCLVKDLVPGAVDYQVNMISGDFESTSANVMINNTPTIKVDIESNVDAPGLVSNRSKWFDGTTLRYRRNGTWVDYDAALGIS